MTSLYETLGIPKDAPPEAVKRAYRKAAAKAHPDRGGSREKFHEIVLARDILSDEKRRARYDRTGEAEEAKPDSFEANAMNLVMEAVDHVFGVCTQRMMDVETVDVVKDAKTYLRGKISQAEAQAKKLRDGAAKMRKFASRFKVKKKEAPNRIALMLEGRAAELERSASAGDPAVAAAKRALEILDDHSYAWREGGYDAPMGGFVSFKAF